MEKNEPNTNGEMSVLLACLLLLFTCPMTWATDLQIIYSNDIRGELEACG